MTRMQNTATELRFSLGKITITRRALDHCEKFGIDYLDLTIRHASGDFGDVGQLDDANLSRAERQHGAYMTDNGLKLNAVAIEKKAGQILSIYQSPGPEESKLWIITNLSEPTAKTSILLPEDCSVFFNRTLKGRLHMYEPSKHDQLKDLRKIMKIQFVVIFIMILVGSAIYGFYTTDWFTAIKVAAAFFALVILGAPLIYSRGKSQMQYIQNSET